MNPNECLSVINDLVKSKDVDDIANRVMLIDVLVRLDSICFYSR